MKGTQLGDEVLRISLLGGFAVLRDGRQVPDDAWRLRKAKTLVKLLALAPDRRLHADQATELMWPDHEPAAARNNLHQAIFAARRALAATGLDGHRCLALTDNVIELCPDGAVQVDVGVFEEAAGRAREERGPEAYREALDAYEGELLPEDRYEDWSASRRAALLELRLALGVELAEIQLSRDPAAAIESLRSVLAEEPLHEPAHRALMRLYAREGRRQEALAQFQRLKRDLRREFEDEPDDETRRLYQEILTRSLEDGAGPEAPPPDEAPLDERHGRLPRQLTSFVGRERELGEVDGLLRKSRLLTLTGAGGCGKTRLALELAAQQLGEFSDGVWSVELAALGEAELIAPAIAQAMDTRLASGRAPEIALAGHIGDREQLLLLDNCEHLVEPVAHLVEALLLHCPRLTILATSREPLRVPGEVTWRVPSLSLPTLDDPSLAAAAPQAESVRLFLARAQQAAPGFELDEDNSAAVATLCHRLDGMPLAIELATARLNMLTPAQIIERLDDSLDVLSGGSRTALTRQQTLRATLAWSFELLDADERVMLRRLAVFAGGFGLEAAEDVCAAEPLMRSEAVAVLGRLVDKSLVHVEEVEGAHRYLLLETVRQYATEQLEDAGERGDFVRRHREWYLELAENDPTPPGDLPATDRLRHLELERDNLRTALATALAEDPAAGLRLVAALWRFWLMRGYLSEGYRWLAAALDAAPEPSAARGRALLATCLIALRRGVHERIHELGAESVEIFRGLDDHAGMFDAVEVSTAYRTIVSREEDIEALLKEHESLVLEDLPAARPAMWAAHARGMAAWLRSEHERARVGFEAALEQAGALIADRRPAHWPLSYGFISLEPESGYPLSLQEDTVVVARRVGADAAIAYMLVNRGAVDRAEGDFPRAAESMEESLTRFRRLDDKQGEAYALNALGNLARSTGDFERGRDLLERSLVLREEIGDRRGSGITLGCLATLLARSGDPAAGRVPAERSRTWFAENDDLIGLSAAELSLASVALCDGDRAGIRAHLEAAAAIFGSTESMHQEGWTLAVLAAICAEDDEPAAARESLNRAIRQFERLGNAVGLAHCREFDRRTGIPSGDPAA
jgi:predicted ATPase/DNA-binding SARP family transcriptional activator